VKLNTLTMDFMGFLVMLVMVFDFLQG